mgnify:CR=1 FL=1
MKKFLSVMLLALAIVFIGNQVEAAGYGEVYVGSYSDGTSIYLLTDSVQKEVWAHTSGYSCKVRAGRDHLDYTFWLDAGNYRTWRYENSEGYSGNVYDGSSPVAAAILNYIRR